MGVSPGDLTPTQVMAAGASHQWLGSGYTNDNTPLPVYSPLQRNFLPPEALEVDIPAEDEDALGESGRDVTLAAKASLNGRFVQPDRLQSMGYAYRKAMALERHKRRQKQAQMNKKNQKQREEAAKKAAIPLKTRWEAMGLGKKDECNPDPPLITRKLRYAHLPPDVRGHLYTTLLSLVAARRKSEFAGKLKAFLILRRRLERRVNPKEYMAITRAVKVIASRSEMQDLERKRWAMNRLRFQLPLKEVERVLKRRLSCGLEHLRGAYTSAAMRRWIQAVPGRWVVPRKGVQPPAMEVKLVRCIRALSTLPLKLALCRWKSNAAGIRVGREVRSDCTAEALMRCLDRISWGRSRRSVESTFRLWSGRTGVLRQRESAYRALSFSISLILGGHISRRVCGAFHDWHKMSFMAGAKEREESLLVSSQALVQADEQRREHDVQEVTERLHASTVIVARLRGKCALALALHRLHHHAKFSIDRRLRVQRIVFKWAFHRQAGAMRTWKQHVSATAKLETFLKLWIGRKNGESLNIAFKRWLQNSHSLRSKEVACTCLWRIIRRHVDHQKRDCFLRWILHVESSARRGECCSQQEGDQLQEAMGPTGIHADYVSSLRVEESAHSTKAGNTRHRSAPCDHENQKSQYADRTRDNSHQDYGGCHHAPFDTTEMPYQFSGPTTGTTDINNGSGAVSLRRGVTHTSIQRRARDHCRCGGTHAGHTAGGIMGNDATSALPDASGASQSMTQAQGNFNSQIRQVGRQSGVCTVESTCAECAAAKIPQPFTSDDLTGIAQASSGGYGYQQDQLQHGGLSHSHPAVGRRNAEQAHGIYSSHDKMSSRDIQVEAQLESSHTPVDAFGAAPEHIRSGKSNAFDASSGLRHYDIEFLDKCSQPSTYGHVPGDACSSKRPDIPEGQPIAHEFEKERDKCSFLDGVVAGGGHGDRSGGKADILHHIRPPFVHPQPTGKRDQGRVDNSPHEYLQMWKRIERLKASLHSSSGHARTICEPELHQSSVLYMPRNDVIWCRYEADDILIRLRHATQQLRSLQLRGLLQIHPYVNRDDRKLHSSLSQLICDADCML